MPWVSALALAAHLGWAPTEAALPVELEWDAPTACPDRVDVLAEVERFVAPEHRLQAAPLRVQAHVTSDEETWVLELVVAAEGGHMQRTLRGDDCKVLASAAALVMAVMVEPSGVLEEVDPGPIEETQEPTPEPTPRAPTTPRTPTTPTKPPAPSGSRQPLRGFVGARGLLTWGAAPGVGGAVALSGGVLIGRVRVGIDALVDVPRTATIESAEDAGARIGLAAAGLRGCYAPGSQRVEVPLCGGLEAGAIWGKGFGLARPKTAVAPWVAVVLETGLSVVLHSRVALRILAEGVVPLRRPQFVVDDRGAVHQPARVGARAGAAIELRLP